MQLQVSDLKKNGLQLRIEKSAASFPVLAQLQQSGECVFLTPVVVDLDADVVGGMVELHGTISVSVELPCSRCLAPCRREISAEFQQTYVEQLPEVTDDDGQELELTAEDMGLELIVEDQIDLVEEIQQQVVLLLPEQPLCTEECKGLCAVCGVDLNKSTCNCSGKVTNLNFAALKDFKVEK
ncbi:MAG: DUF177 domain-containing protein [Desulfuromonas sp.]|nr:DUF177 domain-containing protein [Desulfuromonas sp.]